MVGGNEQEPKTLDMQYHIHYIIRTESSASMTFVLGLELYYPTMTTIWEHIDPSKKTGGGIDSKDCSWFLNSFIILYCLSLPQAMECSFKT